MCPGAVHMWEWSGFSNGLRCIVVVLRTCVGCYVVAVVAVAVVAVVVAVAVVVVVVVGSPTLLLVVYSFSLP